MTDIAGFGARDDVAFARRLVEHFGVAVECPGSSFYFDKGSDFSQMRFCFCKNYETLALAGQETGRAPGKLLEDPAFKDSFPLKEGSAMLPDFLAEETTAQGDSGRKRRFRHRSGLAAERRAHLGHHSHAVEQQHIQLQILGSQDGQTWALRPLAVFPPKCASGEYKLTLPPSDMPYLKAVWRAVGQSRK